MLKPQGRVTIKLIRETITSSLVKNSIIVWAIKLKLISSVIEHSTDIGCLQNPHQWKWPERASADLRSMDLFTSSMNDYTSGQDRRFICTILTITITWDSWPTTLDTMNIGLSTRSIQSDFLRSLQFVLNTQESNRLILIQFLQSYIKHVWLCFILPVLNVTWKLTCTNCANAAACCILR